MYDKELERIGEEFERYVLGYVTEEELESLVTVLEDACK